MNPHRRKALWIASVLGAEASLALYGLSFSWDVADKLFWALIPLFVAGFIMHWFLNVHHANSTGSWIWRMDEFTSGQPGWARLSQYLVMAFFAGHLLWMTYRQQRGVPAIVDGDYVLESHGHILEYLTAEGYFQLHVLELRTFAAFFMGIYLSQAMYWYFQPDASAVRTQEHSR